MLKYKIPQIVTLTPCCSMFRKACLPDIRYKDTKNGKSLDRIYKKVSIKYRNKKNEQVLPNPSPRVRKAQRLFFFYLHQIFVT